MNFRLALIIFALIPLFLLQSCSTRPSVKGGTATDPTAAVPENSPTPNPSHKPYQPRYGHFPGGSDESEAMFGTFPRPKSLEAQVKFWRDVYSTWSRSQVAIHDNEHLNVVYEVLDLPGFSLEGMTGYQKEFLRERMDYWRDRMDSLEAKLAVHAPLNSEEQSVARLFAQCDEGEAAIQGASERIRYQRGIREKFRRGLELSGMYERRFREIFRRAGLPEDLAYLPHVESSYQANARSSAGALGVWQFTAGAARMFMNGDDSVRARLDPIASAQGAARYLSYAYGKLGSWPLAVTSYNHGIGGMQRAKNLYGQNFGRIVKDYDHPLFGFASRNYYAEFLAAREIASQPERFFPEGVNYAKDSDWSLSRLASAEEDQVERPRPLAFEDEPLPRVVRTAHAMPVRSPAFTKGHKVAAHQITVVKVVKGRKMVMSVPAKGGFGKAYAKPGKLAPVKVVARTASSSRNLRQPPALSGKQALAQKSKPATTRQAASARAVAVSTARPGSLQKLKIARR